MTFHELQSIYSKFYYLDHEPDFLKVIVATILCKRLDGESVWLLVLAPPSSGKGMISTASRLNDVVMVSTMTANALMSGARKEDTIDGKNPSLLPKLDGKVMIVKDASTISEMNANARSAVFSQLRSAYDGDMENKHTGVGEVKTKSKFGIIMAGTPGFEQTKSQESNLGERFIHFRPTIEKDSSNVWSIIKEGKGKQKQYAIMQQTMVDFFASCKTPGKIIYPDFIEHLAQQLAVLRGGFSRDRYSKEITWGPTVENPYRVAQQFCVLFTALSAIDNEHNATAIIRRMIVDSIPFQRYKALKYIFHVKNPTATTFRNHIGWGKNTVEHIIQELKILKVLDSKITSRGNFLSIAPKFRKLFHLTPRR